jgi:hypothetical protein
MKVQIWVSMLIAIALSVSIDASDLMTMTVSPAQSFAPASLRVRVRIEPSPENRELEIVADSSEFYRSSLVQLDGDRAPRIVTLDFPGLPGGDYQVRGSLFDSVGHQRAGVRQQARVIPFGGGS